MIVDYYLDVIYSKEQMFKLVADYEKYPEFVKSCTQAITHSIDANSVLASLTMTYAGISQEFSTKTSFYPNDKITMQLDQGPFKRLTGFWEFISLEQDSQTASTVNDDSQSLKTRVRLYMDYELNAVLELLFGAKYHQTLLNMVDNFVQRAHKLYQQ